MSSIYFIRDAATGYIKIGLASDPWKRLRNLQIGCPSQLSLLGVQDGDARMERRLHKQFADARIRGEWFKRSDALSAYISSLGEPPVQQLARGKTRSFWNGFTAAEVNRRTGITSGHLSALQNGHRGFTVDLAMRLQRAVGMDAIALVFGKDAAEARRGPVDIANDEAA